jgi:hypothetical protein
MLLTTVLNPEDGRRRVIVEMNADVSVVEDFVNLSRTLDVSTLNV